MATCDISNLAFIVWKVPHASSVTSIESEPTTLNGDKFTLLLQKILEIDSSQNHFTLSIKLDGYLWRSLPRKTHVSVYIKDICGGICFSQFSEIQTIYRKIPVWKVMLQDLFASREEQTAIFKDGTLTIVFMMGLEAVNLDKFNAPFTIAYADPGVRGLSRESQNLLQTGVHSDIHLQCGDRIIKAHKAILSARSDVFKAKIDCATEIEGGILKIDDIKIDILDQFMHYIYSGKLYDFTDDSARDLYEAAEKYAVKGLEKRLTPFMRDLK